MSQTPSHHDSHAQPNSDFDLPEVPLDLAGDSAAAEQALSLEKLEVGTDQLSDQEIKKFHAAGDLNRERYARALAANTNLRVEKIFHYDGTGEGFSRSGQRPSPLHPNGAAKRYSLITLSNGYKAKLMEGDNTTRYQYILRDPDNNFDSDRSGKVLKAQLESLVEKHVEVAGSPNEKLENFKNSLIDKSLDELLELYHDYQNKPRSGLSSMLVDQALFGRSLDSLEARLNSVKLSTISSRIEELGEIYVTDIEDNKPEVIRSVLVSALNEVQPEISLWKRPFTSLAIWAHKHMPAEKMLVNWREKFKPRLIRYGITGLVERVKAKEAASSGENAHGQA